MIFTIVGKAGFRKGLNLYFDRHDGQAVTCEEFVSAMEDANGVDLSQFLSSWYSQAGTPELTVNSNYDPAAETLTLHVKQACPKADSGGGAARPFEIPLKFGLIGTASAANLDITIDPKDLYQRLNESNDDNSAVLRVTKFEHEFIIRDVRERPVPSLLRGFSAPVKLQSDTLSRDDLLFLAAHDTDPYVRYESVQSLAMQLMLESAASQHHVHEELPMLARALKSNLELALQDEGADRAVVAPSFLPSFTFYVCVVLCCVCALPPRVGFIQDLYNSIPPSVPLNLYMYKREGEGGRGIGGGRERG
jgi:aminopeptidase N